MKILLFILATCCPQLTAHAQGSDHVGDGGGNAVVCFDDAKWAQSLTRPGAIVSRNIPNELIPHIVLVEPLDLAWAKQDIGSELIKTSPTLDPDAWIETLISRFSLLSFSGVNLHTVYQRGKHALQNRIRFSKTGPFPADDIEPLSPAPQGKNCIYTTLAKQRSIGGGRSELLIDERLYTHPTMQGLGQIALLLHEYFLAGHAHSPNAKPLVIKDGLIEFIGTLLRSRSRYYDLMVIVRARSLFGVKAGPETEPDRWAHIPKLEELTKSMLDALWGRLESVLNTHGGVYQKNILSHYSSFPRVLRKQCPLDPVSAISANLNCEFLEKNSKIYSNEAWRLQQVQHFIWKQIILPYYEEKYNATLSENKLPLEELWAEIKIQLGQDWHDRLRFQFQEAIRNYPYSFESKSVTYTAPSSSHSIFEVREVTSPASLLKKKPQSVAAKIDAKSIFTAPHFTEQPQAR